MVTAIAAWTLALGLTAASSPGAGWDEVAAYYRCEGAAQSRRLADAEIVACSVLYERVKLGLVGLDEAAVRALSRRERAEAGRRAFRALRVWEAVHPALVARLKASGER